MLKFFLLAFIPSVVLAQSSSFNSCTGYPSPSNVYIVGCPSQPCLLTRGTDAEMYLTFTPTSTIQALIPRVRATVLGLIVPYNLPGDQQAACNNLQDTTCPLSSGTPVVWNLVMPITEVYPPISLNIEIALMNESGAIISCFNIDATVQLPE